MKAVMYTLAFVGGTLGSLIPLLWGGGMFDGIGILLSIVGTVVGLWVGYKIASYYGLT